jgi:hypothetical protein
MFLRAARLAAVGGLTIAVSEFDRRRPWNGLARLGLAQPGSHLIAQDSQRKQPGYQSVMSLGNAHCE